MAKKIKKVDVVFLSENTSTIKNLLIGLKQKGEELSKRIEDESYYKINKDSSFSADLKDMDTLLGTYLKYSGQLAELIGLKEFWEEEQEKLKKNVTPLQAGSSKSPAFEFIGKGVEEHLVNLLSGNPKAMEGLGLGYDEDEDDLPFAKTTKRTKK